MRLFRVVVFSAAVLQFLTVEPATASRNEARVVRIGEAEQRELRARPQLTSADTCIVRHDHGIVWRIDGWVAGNELFKSYIDPGQSCPSPYPFAVTEINMPMYFGRATPLNVSVDIESVDLSVPDCPMPGELLTISQEYMLEVPGAGLYDIWIPLDTPVTVNGPFFAGFFISNLLDPSDSAAVLCDSVVQSCVSYNIWDAEVGWVDLVDNPYWSFPGRLVLYAAGIPSAGAPPPEISAVSPRAGDTLYGWCELWAGERSESDIIDYVSFEYRAGFGYTEIGRDFDGAKPFRDGELASGSGNGFSAIWDFSSLQEGTYTLRYTVVDTLGNSASDSVTVYLEPTPPVPLIVQPSEGDYFCYMLDLLLTCTDENLTYVQAFQQAAAHEYSAGVPAGGASGYSVHYNAPQAAAVVLKMWADRGYDKPMHAYYGIMPVDTLVARLGYHCLTNENSGTYDEDLVAGLNEYLDLTNADFDIAYTRDPDYLTMRKWVEDEQRGVILGLSGTPGFWVAVDGFVGWQQPDQTYTVRISNPLSGSLEEVFLRSTPAGSELYVGGAWLGVDIMVSMTPDEWVAARTSIGADLNGRDGWSIKWQPSGLTEGERQYIFVTGGDARGMHGYASVLLTYSCSHTYVAGDYNNDNEANIADLELLVRYIALSGHPPSGGIDRGDANCDNVINIADVIYYMNFLFGSVGEPCY